MSSIVLSIFILSIGASFIQRTTGFGFGIFIMTMLPFLMPSYGEATTLSGLLAITTSAAIVWRLRSYVTWQRLWPILLTFIIVRLQAYPQSHLPLHRLCLYLHQRCNHINDKLRTITRLRIRK